jgi:hypothetical protein
VATAETQHSGGDGGGAGEVDEEAARAHPSEVFSEDVDAEPPRAAESEGYSPAVAAIAKPFRWVGTALSTTHRVAVLGAVFAPALLTAPLFHYVLPESWRPWHSELVVSSCELAGGMVRARACARAGMGRDWARLGATGRDWALCSR